MKSENSGVVFWVKVLMALLLFVRGGPPSFERFSPNAILLVQCLSNDEATISLTCEDVDTVPVGLVQIPMTFISLCRTVTV